VGAAAEMGALTLCSWSWISAGLPRLPAVRPLGRVGCVGGLALPGSWGLRLLRLELD